MEKTKESFFKRAYDGLGHTFGFKNFTLEDPNQVINGFTVSQIFGGTRTYAGQTVDEDTALKFSAVWGCIQAFTSPFSYFPIQLYKRDGKSREQIFDHPLLKAINRPLDYMTINVLKERVMMHIKLWGNAYVEPVKVRGQVVNFFIHHPSCVTVKILNPGYKQSVVYEVTEDGKKRTLTPRQILHFPGLGDGIVGKSVIRYAAEDIGLEMARREYGAGFFEGDGKPTGLLSFKMLLKPEQKEQILKDHLEAKALSRDLILGADATYTPISIPPEDAQFLVTGKFSVYTVARWFGVPPFMIGALDEGSTFSNIEEQGIYFLKSAMASVVEKVEAELNTKLLSEDSDLFFEIDMESYLRADSKAMAEKYRTGIQNGYITLNEARFKNGDNPIEGGDRAFIQSNMIPLDMVNGFWEKMESGTGISTKEK